MVWELTSGHILWEIFTHPGLIKLHCEAASFLPRAARTAPLRLWRKRGRGGDSPKKRMKYFRDELWRIRREARAGQGGKGSLLHADSGLQSWLTLQGVWHSYRRVNAEITGQEYGCIALSSKRPSFLWPLTLLLCSSWALKQEQKGHCRLPPVLGLFFDTLLPGAALTHPVPVVSCRGLAAPSSERAPEQSKEAKGQGVFACPAEILRVTGVAMWSCFHW